MMSICLQANTVLRELLFMLDETALKIMHKEEDGQRSLTEENDLDTEQSKFGRKMSRDMSKT